MSKLILALLCASLSFPVISETYQLKTKLGSVIENSVFSLAASSAPADQNPDDIAFIQEEIGISNWELCYDSSVDGNSTSAFHAGCDGKGATVFIAEYNDDLFYGGGITRFAGYSPIDWGETTGYHTAPDARLFDLKIPQFYSPTDSAKAVYVHPSQGPGFGAGHALVLLYGGHSTLFYGYAASSGHYIGWSGDSATGNYWKFSAHPSIKVYAVN
jgi:hypothetical protein